MKNCFPMLSWYRKTDIRYQQCVHLYIVGAHTHKTHIHTQSCLLWSNINSCQPAPSSLITPAQLLSINLSQIPLLFFPVWVSALVWPRRKPRTGTLTLTYYTLCLCLFSHCPLYFPLSFSPSFWSFLSPWPAPLSFAHLQSLPPPPPCSPSFLCAPAHYLHHLVED